MSFFLAHWHWMQLWLVSAFTVPGVWMKSVSGDALYVVTFVFMARWDCDGLCLVEMEIDRMG